MSEDLVKYGKYGAAAIVLGLIAYIIIDKYKKPTEDEESKATAETATAETIAKIVSSNQTRLINSSRTNETGFGRTNLSYTPTEISPTRNAISRT